MAHKRLDIIDPDYGAQPLFSPDQFVVLTVNGEVYNYQAVYASLRNSYKPFTGSDCEVFILLYLQVRAVLLLLLLFSFETNNDQLITL